MESHHHRLFADASEALQTRHTTDSHIHIAPSPCSDCLLHCFRPDLAPSGLPPGSKWLLGGGGMVPSRACRQVQRKCIVLLLGFVKLRSRGPGAVATDWIWPLVVVQRVDTGAGVEW